MAEVIDFEKIKEIVEMENMCKIIRESFNIISKSCRINKDKSSFFRMIGNKPLNIINIKKKTDLKDGIIDIRFYRSNIDSDYNYYGNVDDRSVHFNISTDEYYLNFKIFLENISGLSKYASCGLQKVSEDDKSSLYYHILNGKIMSEVECIKGNDFLSEVSNVVEIRPFIMKKKI